MKKILATPADPAARADAAALAASMQTALLLNCGFVSLVVSFIVLRARAVGWHLAAALSLATFGLMTFLYYIEAQVFLRAKMSPENMNAMLVMGVVFSVLLGPLAVWILGRWRRPSAAASQPVVIPAGSWTWKLSAIGACYVALYLTFGYFVAWQNPALRQYLRRRSAVSWQASVRTGSTISDLPATVRPRDSLGSLLVPLIRAFRRSPAETGFAMALFSAVWCLQLLFPIRMPADIRWSISSRRSDQLDLGFGVGWLLSRA